MCITHTGAGPNFFSPPKSCHALFLLLSTERTAVHSLVLNLWLSSANHRGDRAGADPAKPPDFEQWRHALYLLFRVPSSMDRIEVALWLVRINNIYIYIYMCFLSSKPPTPPLRSRSRTSPWPRPRLQPVRCGQSSPVLVTEQPNSDGGHPKPTITDGLHMCVFYSWFMIDSVVRRLVFQLALYMLPRNQPETSSSQHTRRVVLSPCCTKMRPYMYIYIYPLQKL